MARTQNGGARAGDCARPNGNTNFEAARRFAEFGLAEQASGRRRSASGPGSTRRAAAEALGLLKRAIPAHGIRSVLDLGCGDWHWMKDLGFPEIAGAHVSYEGWEAAPALVDLLDREFARPGVSFRLKDITAEPLPRADLVIARDVLFHIDVDLAAALVARIRASARFLASTSFPAVAENRNIEAYLPIDGWGFHKVNLDIAPFHLKDRLVERVEERKCRHSGDRRYFCLYGLP